MQFSDENVDYVLKDGDWLCTVTQVLDALKKKSLHCKAKTHISERPYFYKKKDCNCRFILPRVVYYWLRKTQKIIMIMIEPSLFLPQMVQVLSHLSNGLLGMASSHCLSVYRLEGIGSLPSLVNEREEQARVNYERLYKRF